MKPPQKELLEIAGVIFTGCIMSPSCHQANSIKALKGERGDEIFMGRKCLVSLSFQCLVT